ncbi:RecX family transcriptional regulator [Roseospira marina]|uniref:RecX family transcriptional regulator n=1 Tax=Roseospira marina TaxID=140057 RepID=UPI0017A5088B|nr:RecX family transcriptional regulator [Roseospira marina]MBB4312402.1 regulatory protein [Roseospira marina]MBB5085582.1 regulatory protein [Roseospira marina]
MFYLQRYSASTERLRRVLARRVERSARMHPDVDRAEAAAWIDALLAKLQRLGLLDDVRHAETKAGALFRRGESRRAIAARLRAEGLDRDTIGDTLDGLADDTPGPDPDLAAAATLARRKRLGPYRLSDDDRATHRQRDLAALARKGFSPSVALTVLDAADVDALDALVAGDEPEI